MKFTSAVIVFATSLASSRAQLTSPALGECLVTETISDFATCFVANSECMDETMIGQVQTCVDNLETPPKGVFDLIRSGCLDYVEECARANAPDFGSLSEIGIPIPILDGCRDSESIEDVLKCVALNSNLPCVNENTISEIETCIGNLETPPENIRGLIQDTNCFDGAKACMQQEIQAFIATLPVCISETMGALGECINANQDLCAASCLDVSVPAIASETAIGNPETCSDFQDVVVTPICGAIACCEPCVDSFHAATECILSELVVVTLEEENCEFTCPIVPTRRLFLDRIKEWFGQNENDEVGDLIPTPEISLPEEPFIFGQCIELLRLESELGMIAETNVTKFLECISQVLFDIIGNGPVAGQPALRGAMPGN